MRGFHWMTCYGDYLREVSYACSKTGIEFENISSYLLQAYFARFDA